MPLEDTGFRTPGPGIPGSCEPPDVSAGNQLEYFASTVPALNLCHFSRLPQILFDGCIDHFGLKVYILRRPKGEHQVLFLVLNLVRCVMVSVMAVLIWLHLDKGVVGGVGIHDLPYEHQDAFLF